MSVIKKGFWIASLTLIGGAGGLFFNWHQFLDMPIPIVSKLLIYANKALLVFNFSDREMWTAIRSVAGIVIAFPRVIIASTVLGALSAKAPFPRVLLYSVIAWPLLIMILQFYFTGRIEQVELVRGVSNVASRILWLDWTEQAFFFIGASLLFLVFAFTARHFTMRLITRLDTSNVATKDFAQ